MRTRIAECPIFMSNAAEIDTESWVELSSIQVAGIGSHRILGLQLVTDKLSEQLQDTLASDAVMVGAVEPTTSIGAGARYPAGIALSPDGTEIRDRVVQRQGGFLSERGGADASTNALTGDIWRDVAGASWFPVPLEGFAPQTVTAATYSAN